MSSGMPSAEVAIDQALVSQLIDTQCPQLAAELREFASGWDNALYRLGSSYIVRLPRRAASAELVTREQVALPILAPQLPVPVPAPVFVGQPAAGYPWSWSVVPWLPGEPLSASPLDADGAKDLATFFASLHRAPVEEAALKDRNPVRGVPLMARTSAFNERLSRLAEDPTVLTEACRNLWDEAAEAPQCADPRWLHGDAHPHNLLGNQGRLTAVIDWGDITIGDAATDVATFWVSIDSGLREEALSHYLDLRGLTSSQAAPLLLRARGWALQFGLILYESGRIDHPTYARIGHAALERLGCTPDHRIH